MSEELEVGDVVRNKDDSPFRSGASADHQAVVISVDPLAWTTEEGNMLWRTNLDASKVEKVRRANETELRKAMRRLPEALRQGLGNPKGKYLVYYQDGWPDDGGSGLEIFDTAEQAQNFIDTRMRQDPNRELDNYRVFIVKREVEVVAVEKVTAVAFKAKA